MKSQWHAWMSWHKLIKEANIQGIDENLELVYQLRLAPDTMQKREGKAIFSLNWMIMIVP